MQFIYLGEALFYKERMDLFLAVAKSLEIKELCNAETQTDVPPNDEPSVMLFLVSGSTPNTAIPLLWEFCPSVSF